MAAKRPAPAQARATDVKKQLDLLMRRYNFKSGAAEVSQYAKNGEEYWSAHVVNAYFEASMPGTWYLTTYWRYKEVPSNHKGPKEVILAESSAGLNVTGGSLATPTPEAPLCIVRYDYDYRDELSSHLNVYQPHPLQDRMHWRLPLSDSHGPAWAFGNVMKYILNDAIKELSSQAW